MRYRGISYNIYRAKSGGYRYHIFALAGAITGECPTWDAAQTAAHAAIDTLFN